MTGPQDRLGRIAEEWLERIVEKNLIRVLDDDSVVVDGRLHRTTEVVDEIDVEALRRCAERNIERRSDGSPPVIDWASTLGQYRREIMSRTPPTGAETETGRTNAFAVILTDDDDRLAACRTRIRTEFRDHVELSDTAFLVSAENALTSEIARRIGLKPDDPTGAGIVFRIDWRYSGYTNPETWEWLKRADAGLTDEARG